MNYITDGRSIVNLNLIVYTYPAREGDRWKIMFFGNGEFPVVFYYETKKEMDKAFEEIKFMLDVKKV